MLKIDSKSINLSGSSVIDNEAIVNFSASVNDPDPNASISINIWNIGSLREHLTTVQNDTSDFLAEIAQNNQQSTVV